MKYRVSLTAPEIVSSSGNGQSKSLLKLPLISTIYELGGIAKAGLTPSKIPNIASVVKAVSRSMTVPRLVSILAAVRLCG